MPKKIKEEDRQRANEAFERAEAIKEVRYLPEPTYLFSIGEKVEIGNLENVKIIEILEGGKVYRIKYTRTDTNYGNPIVRDGLTMYVSWLDIRPLSPVVKTSLVKNADLQLHHIPTVIETLLARLYKFGIDMNPSYQRGYVWSPDDNVALIDSVFSNIGIGLFSFIKLPFREEGHSYKILDGKQRLTALSSFYENRFPYKGLFYNDLDKMDKHHFKSYLVSVADLKDLTAQQELRYFYIMNRAGKRMSEAHLRKIQLKILGEE